MRLIAALLCLDLASVALAGELRGTVLKSNKEEPKPVAPPTTNTPPTAWEIAQPLSPASSAPKKSPNKAATEEALLVLIPQTPGKRPKPPQIVIDKKLKPKPDPAFITLRDTVTFLSATPLTLSFTEEDKPLLVSKKKVTKGFTKEGVYRYTAKESPELKGLIIVGTGAETQEVSGKFQVKNLDDGSWSVYLVTGADIIYAGEVDIGAKTANIDINIP